MPYLVVPRPRQRDPNHRPDEWAIKKTPEGVVGTHTGNTVRTYDTKGEAQDRAKELAKKNNDMVVSYDAALKSSRTFDFRSEGKKRDAASRNRSGTNLGIGPF